MVSLNRSEAVVALGRRLAAQLDDGGDLAAVWLSHLLAERINDAETAPPELKGAAQQACVELILELWRHNACFPDKARPYADMDPILRAIESLDPERSEFRYARRARHAAGSASLPEDAQRWLKFASGVDNTARYLVEVALSQAVEASGSTASEWAQLVEAAAAEEGPTEVVIRFVAPSGDTIGKEPTQMARQKRLETLKTFIELAQSLAAELEDAPVATKSENPGIGEAK